MANTNPKTCPRCGREYKKNGVISRRDDLTEICRTCGYEEVIFDVGLKAVGRTIPKDTRTAIMKRERKWWLDLRIRDVVRGKQ